MNIKILTLIDVEVMRVLTINTPVNEEEFTSKTEEEVLEITYKKCIDNYKTKSKNMAQTKALK